MNLSKYDLELLALSDESQAYTGDRVAVLASRLLELEAENARLKETNEDLKSRLDDYRQDYAKVTNDQCPTDEIHCGCVPILRRENRLLSEELANAKDELKYRRDALIDAQNIYNEANNHRMRYLTALELIASFSNAKDNVSVDELIAIARKELSCTSEHIIDACNYWVMKLRDEEEAHKETIAELADRDKRIAELEADIPF